MNIALFGGTFDPIHAGHLEAARAATRRFRLDKVLFVPTGNPPHKIRNHLTDYAQRYAMVALACALEPRFIPSQIESPTGDGTPRYSIDTVRAVRRRLQPNDRLYFLLGADAFLDLPHWKEFHRLLALVEFIVVSRPGFEAFLRRPQRSGGAAAPFTCYAAWRRPSPRATSGRRSALAVPSLALFLRLWKNTF